MHLLLLELSVYLIVLLSTVLPNFEQNANYEGCRTRRTKRIELTRATETVTAFNSGSESTPSTPPADLPFQCPTYANCKSLVLLSSSVAQASLVSVSISYANLESIAAPHMPTEADAAEPHMPTDADAASHMPTCAYSEIDSAKTRALQITIEQRQKEK